MYSNKVIGMFVSLNNLPIPVLYNEKSDTGNNKSFISTFDGRVIYNSGKIFPLSEDNLKMYSKISEIKDEDILKKLDKKLVYEYFKDDFEDNYPNIEIDDLSSTEFLLDNEEIKNTFKNLSYFVPECKENKSLRNNEELLGFKNKLLEKYSTFKITPYTKDPRQDYFANTYTNRYMIENENIHILNFLDELSLRSDSKEYYKKIFSGLIYDESYGKKAIDIDSFLEYANSIDGLLESIEQVLTDKKFKELQKDVKKNIIEKSHSYDGSLYELEFVETKDFPVIVKIQLKDSLYENCKENTKDNNQFNKICDEDKCVGYYKIHSKDEVYLLNNNRRLLTSNVFQTKELLHNNYLFDNITDLLIDNQKEYNPLNFVIEQLLDNIDDINFKECKIYIDEHKITSRKKLEKVLNDYEKNDLMNEEVRIRIKTPEDNLRIWSEMQPYWMMEDGEDGNLYTGIPILNKKHFEQEINSVMHYHLSECKIDNEQDLEFEDR